MSRKRKQLITPGTYVIGDHHFFHKNIIEYANRPAHHMELLVNNHNNIITDNDKVLFLGDLSFTDKSRTLSTIERMLGDKYLILGNHDCRTIGWYESLGFTVLDPLYKLFVHKNYTYRVLLTHEPVFELPDKWYNIHGHIHRGEVTQFELTDRHFNASCEPLDFTPVKISEILTKWEIQKKSHSA